MVFGTAKWAEVHELRQARLLRPFQATEPHQGLFLGFWREPYYSPDFEPIRYQGDLHQLTVAGTGGGKFTSALATLLLATLWRTRPPSWSIPKARWRGLRGRSFRSRSPANRASSWWTHGTSAALARHPR